MRDLEHIIRPLEIILAQGASGLWRCKQVNEQLCHEKPYSERTATHGNKRTQPKAKTSPQSTPSSLPRRRLAITPMLTETSPTLVTALSFPVLLPKQEKRLATACQTSKTTSIVSNIDNCYRIAGAMIQRLCGNENGTYYDSGRLHSTNVQGFLRIFQRSESPKVRVASDETWDLILAGSHESALSKLYGTNRKVATIDVDWIFLIPQDRRDCNNFFWSLIGIDVVNREIHYHKLHTACIDDQQTHLTAVSNLLRHTDSKDTTDALNPWIQLPPTTSDCITTDSGIWICLLVQLLYQRLPYTIITPMCIREARPYIAMCLLEQKLTKISDMLIRRMGTEVVHTPISVPISDNVHISGLYYPRDNELQGYLHSYNLLHERYFYDPYIDDDSGHNDRHLHHPDGSQILIPPISVDSKF